MFFLRKRPSGSPFPYKRSVPLLPKFALLARHKLAIASCDRFCAIFEFRLNINYYYYFF